MLASSYVTGSSVLQLRLVTESKVVKGGKQIAGSDSGVAGNLARQASFQFRDRNDLPRAEGLSVTDDRVNARRRIIHIADRMKR